MNKRITDEQARLTYERTMKLEQEFGEYFTGKGNTEVIFQDCYHDKAKFDLENQPSIFLFHLI